MGVPKETVDIRSVDLTDALAPLEVRRNLAGDWTLVADLKTVVALPDGRTVRFWGEVRIKGRQTGSRPRKGRAKGAKS